MAKDSCLVLEASGAAVYDLLRANPRLHADIALRAYGRKAPIQAVLSHPSAFDAFVKHQQEEYAAESSEFYSEAVSFAAAASATPPPPTAELRERAVRLVHEFIVEDAPRQINVPANLRAQLEAAIAEGAPSEVRADLFEPAKDEIVTLMRKDTLPRFVNSPLFEELMAALGAPSAIGVAPPKDLTTAQATFLAQHEGMSVISMNESPESDSPRKPGGADAGYAANYQPQ